MIEMFKSWDYGSILLQIIDFFTKFIAYTYDYLYIIFLKYAIFIVEHYIIFFSLSIPLSLFFYYINNKMTFRERSFFWYFFTFLFNPITLILYFIIFLNIFFEKFIYYKLFGVNYLLDLPRKKRDYVLETKYRKNLQSRDITLN